MEELNEALRSEGKKVTAKEGKYLTFLLDNEEYGIGILKIREIIGIMPIPSVPRTPAFVKGIINLRGKVIPIVDLRLKFGIAEAEYTEYTCIIVVEITAASGKIVLGVIVDTVSDVQNIKDDQIEDPPFFGTALDTGFICGMAKADKGVKTLLDIDRVLSAEEVVDIEERTVDGITNHKDSH